MESVHPCMDSNSLFDAEFGFGKIWLLFSPIFSSATKHGASGDLYRGLQSTTHYCNDDYIPWHGSLLEIKQVQYPRSKADDLSSSPNVPNRS